MSEEKKLTDDTEIDVGMIVKALDICYNSPCCTAECPYFNKNGRNLCVENKAFYRDMKRIAQEHAEQKAEIERLSLIAGMINKGVAVEIMNMQETIDKQKTEIEQLTEENAILKGNPPILVGRSLGKTIRAKLLAFDEMKEQNAELQKQVDESKELFDRYFKKAYFYYQKCKAYGIENFYDDELEPKPAKEGKTITFPKFEHIEVE